jgi:hypothetical protein
MPYTPSSRPNPECFVPPNGTRGSDATIAFTNTWPESMPSMKRFVSSSSFVQTLAPRPNVVAFATRTASSTEFTRNSEATGPNVSSPNAGADSGMSLRIVGA